MPPLMILLQTTCYDQHYLFRWLKTVYQVTGTSTNDLTGILPCSTLLFCIGLQQPGTRLVSYYPSRQLAHRAATKPSTPVCHRPASVLLCLLTKVWQVVSMLQTHLSNCLPWSRLLPCRRKAWQGSTCNTTRNKQFSYWSCWQQFYSEEWWPKSQCRAFGCRITTRPTFWYLNLRDPEGDHRPTRKRKRKNPVSMNKEKWQHWSPEA